MSGERADQPHPGLPSTGETCFYPGDAGEASMGMNIKNPQAQAMARERASQRGTSVTDAVRQARLQAPAELQERCPQLSRPHSRDRGDIETEQYAANGLPW
jgi:hypothetical protein